MKVTSLLLSFAAAAIVSLSPAAAEDVAPSPIVSGGDTTIVYVFPTSPQTFVPIATLPSFLVMPGADIPAVATQVVYTRPVPAAPVPIAAALDVECSNFVGVVRISGPDTFNLDRDGDGKGCESEDR